MRKPMLVLAGVATTGALAIPAFAATRSVTVGDNYFVRSTGVPTVTVKRNDTVAWTFRGRKPHNVSVSRGPVKFTSRTMSRGTYRKKMTRSGTYTIVCTVHGARDQSMKLVVR